LQWEEISVDYGNSNRSDTDSDENKDISAKDKILNFLGLGGKKKKDTIDGGRSILPTYYPNATNGSDDANPNTRTTRSRRHRDKPNNGSGDKNNNVTLLETTNTGTRQSSEESSHPLFNLLTGKNKKKKKKEENEEEKKRSVGEKSSTDDEEDSSTTKKKILWVLYLYKLPILLVLLLLLAASIAVVSVLLHRKPRVNGGDKLQDEGINNPSNLFPTASPTVKPLLDACVCYPLMEEDNLVGEIVTNSTNNTTITSNGDIIYNIGGTEYKCLEESLSITTTYLTICAFPHPNSDPNIWDDYHLGGINNGVDGVSATTTGELSVPNLNQGEQVVGVTSTGSFATTNLDIPSFTEEQISEVMGYFENAIAQEVDLPVGSIVTVTSIDENGVVQYEITTYAESSAEANAAASSVSTALSQASTLTSITESVFEASQASSDSSIQSAITSSTSIASHTTGSTTESTTSKVTSTGELSVAGFDPSVLTSAEIEEAKSYFESAITQELVSQGVLQEESSVVVVTDISSDGSVQYDTIFYGLTSTEASSAITDIQTSLSNTSTLASISSIIQEESSSLSSFAAVSTSLSTVSITENTQLGTTGLTLSPVEEEIVKVYFEEAIAASLGSILPPGSTVTVTSVKDGLVSYEITMTVSSSDVAEATVTAIESSLAEQSTLQAITSSVETASSSVSVTTSGDLSVPNLNQEVLVVGVTATGSFATTNLDISSFSEVQMSDVIGYFENAIAQEVDLPVGSIVNVTSIDENGVVQYEITTYAETSAEANAAANSASTALSQASTLTSITESVLEASQASSDSSIQSAITSSTSIASHTTGGTTESTTSKVTSTGELSVAGFDPSVLTPAEIEEAKSYFESAITQELASQGLLQEGSSAVVVTGISSDGSSIQYDIIFYGLTSTEASSAITDIQTSLSNTSTLASISSIVQEESSISSSSAAVSSSLSTVGITENTQLGTTGLTLSPVEEEIVKVYFEEAIAASLGSIPPPGSVVSVTDIENGVVSYEITMEVSSSDVAEATVTDIESSLAEQSTLQAITSSVQSASSASTYPTLVNAMSGISVVSNTVGCGCSRRSRELNNALHRELNSCCSGTSAIYALSDSLYPEGVVSNTPGITSVVPSTPSTVSLNSLQMVSSYDLGVDVYILLTICFLLSHSFRRSYLRMAPLHHTTC